ncbi:type III-B CRISPR module RAMP protein Cmr4 [Insolitispirillum peregrinum]|uniref:type III-B CRISPR module RAMP protein Cmr4 n=1 Tax=Insolitispirillum peregrinum TaxID=80876 RepID=UPI00360EFB27
MSALLLGLLAETSIHPGSGQDDGVIDLPVQREKTTCYPVIPGSSVKGGLRDYARQCRPADSTSPEDEHSDVIGWFGKQDSAGSILVGDARLLLLPVRSLTGNYRWLTCPALIERLQRDRRRAGLPDITATNLKIAAGKVWTKTPDPSKKLFLEECSFEVTGSVPNHVITMIKDLIADGGAQERLENQIAVISDDDFTWFAQNALSIQARNCLDADTKTSRNLWYEETLPPDTLFHCLLVPRTPTKAEAVDTLGRCFGKRPYLQLGGNETIGQGWFLVKTPSSKG